MVYALSSIRSQLRGAYDRILGVAYSFLALRNGDVFLSAYAEDHGLCPWMNA